MKSKLWSIILLSQIILSCNKELITEQASTAAGNGANKAEDHHLKVAIVSDIHYMCPGLLVGNAASGLAFQNYINQDPKLVQYSDAIFRQVFGELKTEK